MSPMQLTSHARLVLARLVLAGLALIAGPVAPSDSQQPRAERPQATLAIEGGMADAVLASIDSDQAKFLDRNNRERTLQLSNLVRWGYLAKPVVADQVVLRDGSLLLGEVTRIDSEQLVCSLRYFGELIIPREQILCVLWNAPSNLAEQWRFRDALIAEQTDADLLLLGSDDRLTGRMLRADRDQIQFVTAAGELTVKRALVAALRAGGVTAIAQDSARYAQLGMTDGAILVATDIQLADRLQVTLACGVELVTLAAVKPVSEALVCYFRPAHVQVTYLSELPSAGFKHVPFLTQSWSWRADRNVMGGPLTSLDGLHSRGIGMHSTSRLAYDLIDKHREFQAEICLDQSAGEGGSVHFRVFVSVDGTSWQEAYHSDVVRGGAAPVPIRVDVRAARRIALVIDFAERGDQLDRANWLDARLVR